MTVAELTRRARLCKTCGKPHKPKVRQPGFAPSWAAADGHPYRSLLPLSVIAQIEALASRSDLDG